jgi:hypothetical protein
MAVGRRRGLVVSVLVLAGLSACAVTRADEAVLPTPAPVPVAESATPTPTPSPTASPGSCLVGTWKQTAGTDRFKFYSNVGELTFKTSGAVRILRADGTGTMKYAKTRFTSSYKGRSLAIVYNGQYDFTWSATPTRLVYGDITKASTTVTFYESGANRGSSKFGVSTRSVPNTYTCAGSTSKETGTASVHTATWART